MAARSTGSRSRGRRSGLERSRRQRHAGRVACAPCLMGWLGLPRLWCIGAKEPADSLGIEFVFVPEMTVEPASRQTSVLHHFIYRDLGKSLFVEEPSCAFDDFLACVALMLG